MKRHHLCTIATALSICSITLTDNAPTAASRAGFVTAKVSCAELVDKITILEIKSLKFDGEKKKNVDIELEMLREVLATLPQSAELQRLKDELYAINLKFWNIQDDIRAKERDKQFDQEFIELARSVYVVNESRNQVKYAINKLCSSTSF